MTTPEKQKFTAIPAGGAQPLREWCCGTPITSPHLAGCAYEPRDPGLTAEAPKPPAPDTPTVGAGPAAFAAPEPPEAPAQRPKRKYGFHRSAEFDVDLPTGAFVKMRQLTNTQAVDLGLVNMRDAFSPELLKGLREALDDGDEDAQKQAAEFLISDETKDKIWGPIDRAIALVTVDPIVVLDRSDADDEHVHVSEIDLRDKLVMFDAALPDELKAAAQEGQLAALKSVRT